MATLKARAADSVTDADTLDGLDSLNFLKADGTVVGSTSQAQDFGATGIKADVVAESTGTAGVTADGVLLKDGGATLTGPLIQQEESSDPSTPASGYRAIYPRDTGGLHTQDDAGYTHGLAFADGRVVPLPFPLAITLTKAGAAADSDSDADGAIVIDKTNGRIYFRHGGGTWHYVARLIDQAEMNLTAAAAATKQAVRYDEFSAEHTAATGAHVNTVVALLAGTQTFTGAKIFSDDVTFQDVVDFQEETADLATPAAGYRRTFARDSGGLFTKDDAGYVNALAFAGGNMAAQIDEPRPASWQHKDAATGSAYGDLRIEWGRDTLATGTKAITFQQAFSGLLEVFLIDKTAANAMFPSALGTTGFTANGTASDTFAWLAIGYDGR